METGSSSTVPTVVPRSSSGVPTPALRHVKTPQPESMMVDQVPESQPEDEGADFQRCRLCARHHALRVCQAFRAMQPAQRYLIACAHHFCTNCLALSHHSSECLSVGVCKLCGQRHHTLLHRKSAHSKLPPPHSAPAPRRIEANRSHRRRRYNVTRNANQKSKQLQHARIVKRTANKVRNMAGRGKATRMLVKEAIRKLRELESSLSA
ncbi:PREDICTED: uncharacterized protein LOC108373499 [Rhagoletis zephyria]|uniref:uncharacterized protein LOC108373499 n=1 Tax=Rhagoletis zephyria TaxID=28612 RepID=UPI00081147A1|nr:PREDICTED: uncharacterized protein LOC108373499 [Rhagoletis zephyria]XP_017484890.1 PREDICTED: uncharacterized protein LOC108373499 [Rhagoletis zephyria]